MTELLHSYKYLVDFAPEPCERITPLIKLNSNHRKLAVSIVEREFSGSECYAIFIYELADSAHEHQGSITQKTMLDGTVHEVQLTDIVFSTSSQYEEMCCLIEKAVERLYAEIAF